MLTLTRRAQAREPRATLALFPSLGTTTRVWDPVLARLQSRDSLRILLFDLPGHGSSEPGDGFDIAGLVDDAGSRIADEPVDGPLFVAGVSLGGAIAAELARRAPVEIAGFASFCSALTFGSRAGWQRIIDQVRAASTPAFDREATRSGWFTEAFAIGAGAVVVDEMLADLAAVDPDSYVACCRALQSYDGAAGTPIPVPGLAVGATADRATPASGMRDLAALGADIEYAELPGAHLAVVEHPALAARLLDDFLDSALAQGTGIRARGRVATIPAPADLEARR